jgi:hypothetical protein
MKTWATDIGNAYLEAVTAEKVYILAGPEFGELEGHILVVFKALYGLHSSGLRWYERFSRVMKAEGFTSCKLEPEIWMRSSADATKYEDVAVYVDDLAMAMDDPEAFLNILITKYNFKLKGSGEINFHLGCDFFRDEDGTLCMKPEKYISKMVQGYEQMFGCTPKRNVYSPLEKGDHPELDTSDLCDGTETQQYQSLIGSLQWAVSIGRIDITTAVMTLSSFRAVPRKGHLERAKRVVSYVAKFKESTIRFRTQEPDYSDIPALAYDWEYKYGEAVEDIPTDAPTHRSANSLLSPPTLMPTYATTSLRANPSLASFTGSMGRPLNGSPRSRVPSKPPPTDPNLWLHASVSSRSRPYVTHFGILAYPSELRPTCLEIISW